MFKNPFRDSQVIKNGSKKELGKFAVSILKKKWITKIKSGNDFTDFYGSKIPLETLKNPFFQFITRYVGSMFDDIEFNTFKTRNMATREMQYYDHEGGLCIYMSVLAYTLFMEFEVLKENQLYLVQGYYRHDAREDNPFATLFGSSQAGVHAWLNIKDAVYDLSIGQEKTVFDFKGTPFILGKVPEGMDLRGFVEPRKVVKEYQEKFAKAQNMSIREWTLQHKLLFVDFAEKEIEEQYGITL
jgi:hypothetical protein